MVEYEKYKIIHKDSISFHYLFLFSFLLQKSYSIMKGLIYKYD